MTKPGSQCKHVAWIHSKTDFKQTNKQTNKLTMDFNLNLINNCFLMSIIELFENSLKIVTCSSSLVAMLHKKSVFFCLANSRHVYFPSIDDFDDLMSSRDSTEDSMYQRVMLRLGALILLIQFIQHRVTWSNACIIKIETRISDQKNKSLSITCFG